MQYYHNSVLLEIIHFFIYLRNIYLSIWTNMKKKNISSFRTEFVLSRFWFVEQNEVCAIYLDLTVVFVHTALYIALWAINACLWVNPLQKKKLFVFFCELAGEFILAFALSKPTVVICKSCGLSIKNNCTIHSCSLLLSFSFLLRSYAYCIHNFPFKIFCEILSINNWLPEEGFNACCYDHITTTSCYVFLAIIRD